METSKIIVLTPEELKGFAEEAATKAVERATGAKDAPEAPNTPTRFVYGLRGIRELFGVSHPTAQKYKNTFLAPAIMQRGRKIVVDVAKAIELYRSNTDHPTGSNAKPIAR